MPSRLPSLKVVLIVFLPCMLALGIWLGGHPQFLPGPVADALVGPEDRRITLEALDTIHDKYYRAVDRGKLSDARSRAPSRTSTIASRPICRRSEYGQFRLSLNNEFSGVGTAVRGVKTGLRIVTVYPKSPAKKAGIRVGDIVTKANGHKLAGLTEEAATALDQGSRGDASSA